MKKVQMVLFVFLGLCFTMQAQKSKEFLTYKKAYPNAIFVRLQQETTYNIKLKDDKINITKQVFEQDLYLSDLANANSQKSLSYSTFYDLDKIEASSFTYQNNTYKEIPVKTFNEKNDVGDTFYDDSKEISFIYADLKKGGKTQISYQYNIKNPRFLSAFYLGDFFPVINNKITIIVDKNISLDFKELNTQDQNIDFQKKKKGRKVVYTWTKKDTQKFEIESNAPNYKTVLPHIIPIITSYKGKKKEEKVLDGVEGLYRWYYSLVKDINQESDDPELVQLVKELTQGKDSDLEKVKAIYYWTQKNIKYIAFEYALGGFIPREANDVFNKKYGDCKDNSSILYKMLEIANLKGNLTWIGTRSIPYTYSQVPTPAVDNHMILSYEDKNGKTYYLDATGRYIQIDYPSSFIQGKEALVSYGEDFKIKKVPVVPADMNAVIDSTFVRISDNGVAGNSITKITGYLKNDLFSELEALKRESQFKDLYNYRFKKGNNKFLIQSYQEKNKFSYEDDFIVAYDFTIDSYIQKVGAEIFINPHFNKMASYFKTKKDRKNAIEYDYKTHYSYTNIIEIPKGHVVEYLPESVKIKNDFIDFRLNYTIKDNKIICQENTTLDYLVLTLEEQKVVNKAIKKAEKAYKEIIILKKK